VAKSKSIENKNGYFKNNLNTFFITNSIAISHITEHIKVLQPMSAYTIFFIVLLYIKYERFEFIRFSHLNSSTWIKNPSIPG
jgi:hypothetical protein